MAELLNPAPTPAQYTVWPLFQLINELPKAELTAKELAGVVPRLAAQRAGTAAAAIGATYQKIITAVQAAAARPRVAKTHLQTQVDRIMRADGWGYTRHTHAPLYGNLFYRPPSSTAHDWAFYSTQDPEVAGHAHREDHQKSSFYARVEQGLMENELLIGNLQHGKFAGAPGRGKINNLRTAMVLESLRAGAATGATSLVLHSGDAMQIAQFGERRLAPGPDNFTAAAQWPGLYAHVWRHLYTRLQTAAPLPPGELLFVGPTTYRVVAQTPDTLKILPLEIDNQVYFPLLHLFDYYAAPTAPTSPVPLFGREILSPQFKAHWDLIGRAEVFSTRENFKALMTAAAEDNFTEIYERITELFARLTGVRGPDPQRSAKIDFLAATRTQYFHMFSQTLTYLAAYLQKFNHNSLLLAKFKFLTAQPDQRALGGVRYTHKNLAQEYFALTPGALAAGTTGGRPAGGGKQFPFRGPPAAQKHDYYPLYQFYEKDLPKILTKLGINFRVKPLVAVRTRPAGATLDFISYGWEITDPPEKIQALPIPLF